MTKLKMVLVACFSLLTITSFAQTGSIKGTIRTSDGHAAPNVEIEIKGTRKAATTNSLGEFEIKNVKPGNYFVKAHLVGFKSKEEPVEIGDDEAAHISITLNEDAQQLKDVTINGSQNKFASKESDYVARMPLKNLENPQVYNVVTKEIIKDQQVVDFQSALQNVTGGTPMQNPDRSIFIMLRGFEAYGNVRNGMSTGSGNFGNIDPINLERIEILKGPSGTLFGSSITSYGGVVNRVTKKPYESFGGELSYTGGGYDLSRITADVNTPLNNDKTALLRINAAAQNEGSFLDAGGQRKWTFAPSFLYKINDRLTFTLDAEMAYTNATALIEGGQGLENLSARKWNEINLPYNSSLTNKDLRNRDGAQNIFAGVDYKLSDNWTSHTNYSYGLDQLDEYNMVFTNFTNDSLLSRSIYAGRNAQFRTLDLQQNFNGLVHTGSIKHRLLFGVDYYKNTIDYPSAYVSYDNDVNFTQTGTDNININRVNDSIASNGIGSSITRQQVIAAYGSDVVNFTDNLIGMASVRVDDFIALGNGGYNQTAVSPKFGLVYQPIKGQLSLFANYMNGFQNTSGSNYAQVAFKPQHAYQYEGGVKANLFNGKLNATLSYYNILVSNLTRSDLSHPGFQIQDATQRSQGFEAEVITNPIVGLNIVAGYGYNDNAYVKTEVDLEGKRPVESPANTVNFWASYKIQEGALRDFALGFGGNYVSEMYGYFDASNHTALPAYTLLRATLSYNKPRYSLGIKVDNITNQHYWNSNGQAQGLATLTGTVSFRF